MLMEHRVTRTRCMARRMDNYIECSNEPTRDVSRRRKRMTSTEQTEGTANNLLALQSAEALCSHAALVCNGLYVVARIIWDMYWAL